MKTKTIVVLGGAFAGPAAAARARETDEHARVILMERNTRVSYAVCGLCFHVSGEVGSMADLNRERADFFSKVYRIEVWTQSEATHIDAQKQILMVKRNGRAARLSYDAMVFAAGAASRIPVDAGLKGKNAHALRTMDDLEALMKTLQSGKKRVAVIGAGPLGIEAVDGLVRAGAEVTLIEKGKRILPPFGTQVSEIARHALVSYHVKIYTGNTVASVETSGGAITKLKLSSGKSVETDFVISAVGLVPRTELLAKAGACLSDVGAVAVDNRCQTSLRNIFACGVCVSVPHAVTGSPVWLPQGAIADKTAQVAGANAAGGNARLTPALGTMLVRVLNVTAGRTGLSCREADAQIGENNVAVTVVHAPSRDVFFPGSGKMLVRLVWDRRNGKILGAEAAGKEGVDKRMDAAASAIAGGLTVEQFANLDFGYAPPYNAARDPLNVAATVAASELRGLVNSISPRLLARNLKSVQLVDVRSEDESHEDEMNGAKVIPLEKLRASLFSISRKKPVVVVSGTGRRGYLAARILTQNGFSDVSYLSGGIVSWKLAGN